MKRRIVSVMMAVIMAFSLTACEEKTISDVRGSVSSVSEEASVETSTETSVEASIETSAEASVEESDDEPTGRINRGSAEQYYQSRGMYVDEAGVPVIGSADAYAYVNEFFGFKAVPDGSFQFISEDVDSAIEDATAEFLENTDSETAQKVAEGIREEDTDGFYMADASLLNTVNAQITNVSAIITEANMEYLLDESIKQMEEVFSGDTIKASSFERTTMDFLGKERHCIKGTITMETQGITLDFYILSVSLIKDGCLCTFSFGSYLNDNTEEMTEMIQVLED